VIVKLSFETRNTPRCKSYYGLCRVYKVCSDYHNSKC